MKKNGAEVLSTPAPFFIFPRFLIDISSKKISIRLIMIKQIMIRSQAVP